MRKLLVVPFLLTLAAGCSNDWHLSGASGAPDPASTAGQASPGFIGTGSGMAVLSARRDAGAPFASQPDRGDLVHYPERRVVRQDGAYTWHRADLSEAHALNAIGGVLRLTAPNGAVLDFVYERHVEHPSGDWTWVGRLRGGQRADEVILTFGDKAAFGTVAQNDGLPLKLTTSDGAAWLIETDPVRLASIRNEATHPTAPDFLVPPESAASTAQPSLPASAFSIPSSALSTATAATVVDLVLGYTRGFAAARGGQSAAVTRLNNMVEVANQAYANSQVNARVRLVHTVQVDFPDNTSNKDALHKLTGHTGTSTTTPDPAFNALRAARDQYGGDLVSLVRVFHTPENDGCGVAWLIGGGRTSFTTRDAPFGYSVVSDGTVPAGDGTSYFCRDETLAHELGHNMGSQHDRATATENGVLKPGVFDYSYGYKTDATAGNFYTVMAYGEPRQKPHRVFSNPRTNFCGWPCGIEGQADNARSLGQTMPIVAGFRSTVVPVMLSVPPSDVNADGRSDLLWVNPAFGRVGYWLMSGGAAMSSREFPVAQGYRIAASGDFNGDGRIDLLWTSAAEDLWMWLGLEGGGFGSHYLGTYSGGWQVSAAADLNGDNRADLVWHNPATGRMGFWLMNGPAITQSREFAVALGYRIAAIGDFDGNGRADIVWTSDAGDLWIWPDTLNGNAGSGLVARYGGGWQPIGSGDVDGDGKADLLWHHPGARKTGYWLMNGGAVSRTAEFPVAAGYSVMASGDYDGNGRVDLMWGSAAGDLWLWPTVLSGDLGSGRIASFNGGWQPVRNPAQP